MMSAYFCRPMKKILFLLFIVCTLSNLVLAQNNPKEFYLIELNPDNLEDYDRTLIDSIMERFHASSNKIEQLELLNDLIDNCYDDVWMDYNMLMRELAIEHLKKSKDSALINRSHYYYGISYGNEGYIYDMQDKHDSALFIFNKGIEQFELINSYDGIGKIENSIAGIYESQGKLQLAIDHYMLSAKNGELAEDHVGLANLYANLGRLNKNLDNDSIAFKHYEKGYEHAKIGNDIRLQGLFLTRMAYYYIISEDYTTALQYAKEGLGLMTEAKVDDYNKIPAHKSIGDIYRRMNMLDSAEYYYNITLHTARTYESLEYEAMALHILASVHYLQDNFTLAKEEALESIEIAKENNLLNMEIYGLYELQKAEHALGNHEAAYNYLQEYNTLNKQYVNDENKEMLIAREAQLEYEKQKAIDEAEYEKNLAIAEEEKKQQRTITFSVLAIAFVVLLALIALYNRFQLIRKQKEELNQAYAKLEESKKNELMASNLKALQSQMNPHFIFNALNSIQTLVLHGDVDNSYTYINKFASLIRTTLNFSELEYVAIEEEIKLLDTYLNLEKLRFKEDFNYEIIEGKIPQIKVPPMLIQPFVENALKHGLLHRPSNRFIKLSFTFDDVLVCVVEDNGIGRKASAEINKRRDKEHKSFAISAIQQRFSMLQEKLSYPIGFTYEDLYEGDEAIGTRVVIRIPYINHSSK